MNKNVFIPQKISRYGIISAHMFLLASYFSHIKGLNTNRNLLILLYLTSIIYWYKLDDNSIRKYLDILVVNIVLFYFTFYESKNLSSENKKSWYFFCFIMIIIYILNNLMYYKQIVQKSNYVIASEKYNYFKFKYTKPNSKERKIACMSNVFVHILFFHVIASILYINFIKTIN